MRAPGFLLPTLVVLLAAIGLTGLPAGAQNYAPPTGAIYDLNGLTVPHGAPQLYFTTFTAPTSNASTAITFAFRDDPWFIQFSNVSLVDVTTGSGNLLANGDFSGGAYLDNLNYGTPLGWTYSNIDGAAFGGSVSSACVGASYCWNDGAVQGYDELSQNVATTGGDQYELSFSATDLGGPGVWSSVSTNGDVTDSGGNGADILAYVGGIVGPSLVDPPNPKPAPELSTWAMMLAGFLGLGVAGYRRAARARAAGSPLA